MLLTYRRIFLTSFPSLAPYIHPFISIRVNSWLSMLMELLCYDTAVHNKSYAGPLLFYTKPLKTVWLMN